MNTKQTYFEGLNTLRAIAALVVLIGHIEVLKFRNKLPNALGYDFFHISSGHTGVVLFFVLSGFLITYLLIHEQKETNTISLKAFYIKRILRVWPLYFLILIVSSLVMGFSPSTIALICCVLIFPNISHALDLQWIPSPQVWSIGVEEQFYLVHPLLVRITRSYLLWFLVFFFIAYTFLPQFIVCTCSPSPQLESFIRNFAYGSKYNCMALGGICAILQLKYASRLKKFFENKLFASCLTLLPFIFWAFPKHIYLNDLSDSCFVEVEITQEVFAILFGALILVLINNPFITSFFKYRFLNYLGEISYGI